ncbi:MULTISPECIES: DUF3501 family protein [Burkholderia]|uniref:DUF3501 family protein n=1 Tax=Burkholderia savannae TaxID=1637837 RepID=A0ABR5T382_9BURK|nr:MULTISPECIES: DUF3501 family protein [Burkholderia]AOJ73024.1 hypothetical protein WS78_30755 [Burkholderia savannae]AOK49330.1 hypothetical protein WT60_20560 [Burkholderia sp. MSMB617WGS]KGS02212.1 hypothetical protein X946_3506 [Burkholderia sp. ABCPW 111]KVG46953.1 hypothetical protein WS77_29410 [Burkholderia sp. MSMB0265]KVG85235.1 hypothetical protein WS81_04605 [Burkholderia sp. MSMB2040]
MTLTRDSLLTLEAYAKVRRQERARVIEHKKRRAVPVGNHLRLLFEDETTIRYQIHEMLHVEKIFDEDGISAELDAYLPLVPDGSNLKATMQIEYENETQRRAALTRLIGIEDRVFLVVGDETPVYAIADEDLERETAQKTSAVHFLRFELSGAMKARLKAGAPLSIGCDHPNYPVQTMRIDPDVAASLAGDLD